jgi:hypothetical protein
MGCLLCSPHSLPLARNVSADSGIAEKYPGDRGIQSDPKVVFTEDFENELSNIESRWDTVRDREIMSLSADRPPLSAGRQSLLMSQVAEKGTGGDLYRLIPGENRLFMRMYVRIDDDCEPIHHFGTCIGGIFPPTRWPSVKAGQPTDGARSFWLGIEPFGEAWRWDYYAYWCEMRGSPPRGQTWGNSFIHDPKLVVQRGKWTCIEVMVQMNDVGLANGELALWIDGTKVSHLGPGYPRGRWEFDKFKPGSDGQGVKWNRETGSREYFTTAPGGDPFEGFRFRTDPNLKINYVWLYTYITKGSPGHINRVWYDDVVIARDYIGPIHPAQQ